MIRKLCDEVSCGGKFYSSLATIDHIYFRHNFCAVLGYVVGALLCDKVQGVERFSTHISHFLHYSGWK